MKMKQMILVVLLIAGISYQSKAQVPGVPNASSTQTIIQELGLGKVSVTYSRPNVKARKIFGELVPYGQVWRTGANAATSIDFSENVIINGKDIPAGKYALFCIPEENEWTIILNKQVDQWGAYTYDQHNDFLRFQVKPERVPEEQETFTVLFTDATTKSVNLTLSWERSNVTMHIATNDDAKIMANIEKLMAGKDIDNLVYFNCIQYYYVNSKDIEKALKWIAKAEKDYPAKGSYRLYKSRFLLRKGDKAGAIAAAEEGIRISKSADDGEYLALNQEALELAKK